MTPDQPKRHREFWINEQRPDVMEVEPGATKNPPSDAIHVIEYAAFEELRREYDELHSVTSEEMSALAKQVEELSAEIDERIQEAADLERVVISVRAELQWSLKNEAKYKDELAKAMAELARVKDTPGGKRIYGALGEIQTLTSTCEKYRAALEDCLNAKDDREVERITRHALEPEGKKK